MTNRVLYFTSWVMMMLHYAAVGLFFRSSPVLLQWLYLCGPWTSAWNHGTTSFVAKWADRSLMAVGCVLDIYFVCSLLISFIPPLPAIFVLANIAMALLAYACAKRTASAPIPDKARQNAFHSMAHAFITAANLSLLYFIHMLLSLPSFEKEVLSS